MRLTTILFLSFLIIHASAVEEPVTITLSDDRVLEGLYTTTKGAIRVEMVTRSGKIMAAWVPVKPADIVSKEPLAGWEQDETGKWVNRAVQEEAEGKQAAKDKAAADKRKAAEKTFFPTPLKRCSRRPIRHTNQKIRTLIESESGLELHMLLKRNIVTIRSAN